MDQSKMSRYIALILGFISLSLVMNGQPVTTNPALPSDNQIVTIYYDATKGTAGLKDYAGDVYAHIGVITDKSSSSGDWKYLLAGWSVNIDKAKMIRTGTNQYKLDIVPDARAFFGVPAGEKILKIAMVFRSGALVNGSYLEGKDTGAKDIFVDVFEQGLNLVIQQPSKNKVFQLYADIAFSAVTSLSANLELYLNNQKIKNATSTQLTHTFNLNSGNYWVKVVAITTAKTISDSVFFHVLGNQVVEKLPAGAKKGISYPGTTSALLVLWAPFKQNVFVLGDFNGWRPETANQMKRDGDYFWLQINNLTSGKEYAFQYLIDGSLKIADPYSTKISDPLNDQGISATTYPGLMSYPTGKTEGITSVLQTSQSSYNWQVTNFKTPASDTCVIYETLIRDFDSKHTYTGAIDHLDYLKNLKVNVLELMPVNEFEGNSSWGYNPSFYFAPDKYYGSANDLKKLIDQCHQRGIAVVIDMVLNHSYGQSPFVQLYFSGTKPTTQNPWYNVQSNFLNPDAQWGYDFNHESSSTRELVDSICSYWMSQYKVDGFRFDFTKGFSNNIKDNSTDSWGSKYDAQRIANLKRMASEIRKRKPDALIIFEHLADNNEEKELIESGNGILLWANSSGNTAEAAMGYHDSGKSDFSWASYTQKGWNKAAAVGYMESHDEERMAYKCIKFGNSLGTYNISDSTTAYKRAALTATLFFMIPGPKMVWQFGELGYDYSIEFNGRLGEKPVRWDYVDKPSRSYLLKTMSKLFYLKKSYPIFNTTDFSYSLAASSKWIKLNLNGEYVLIVGNFGVANSTVELSFQKTGAWYEYFSGSSSNFQSNTQSITLTPGEFRLYSTQIFKNPDISTDVEEIPINTDTFIVWPNPVNDYLKINSSVPLQKVAIFSISGSKMSERNVSTTDHSMLELYLGDLPSGTYIIQVLSEDGKAEARKIIKF